MLNLSNLLESIFTPKDMLLDSSLDSNRKYKRMDLPFQLIDNGIKYQTVRSFQTRKSNYEQEEKFYCRRIKKSNDNNWIKMIIQQPVYGFLWPSDVIFSSLENNHKQYWLIRLPAVRNCCFTKLSDYIDKINRSNLNTTDQFHESFHMIERTAIAKQILNVASNFYKTNLRYCNWRAENIYIDKDNQVRINFSENICQYTENRCFDKDYVDWSRYYNPYEENYGEYGDYYSLLILIFYLLIGRLPFHGKLNDISFESSNQKDYINNEYRQNAIFIFDSDNTDNSIGTYTDEKKHILAWKYLEQDIKDIFIAAFKYDPQNNAKYLFEQLCNRLK